MGIAPLDRQDELTALRAVIADQAAKLALQQAALRAEVEKRDAIISILRAQLDLLRHGQHGASSEKIDRRIEQYELMLEEIEAARAESEARSAKTPLPDQDETTFLKAADKVTQVMEHVPSSMKIVRHVEKRMVCRGCDTTLSGNMPSLPTRTAAGGKNCFFIRRASAMKICLRL